MAQETSSVSGNIVDVINKRIFKGKVLIEDGIIKQVIESDTADNQYILPGFVDAHIHIESSLLTPTEFARVATIHGTVAAVCDPHEIANVLGKEGIRFLIKNAGNSDFHFRFGAPPCVPATTFETAGAKITTADVEELLESGECQFLSEVMNYKGVINGDKDILQRIDTAKRLNLPIDGHAPGLTGEDLRKYIAAGITTDHESITIDEAREKINGGMKIIIREGSAAKNFDELIPLIAEFPESIMFCTDDINPQDLRGGHINNLVKRAIKAGYDTMDVIRAATFNPVMHYRLSSGLLRDGQSADMIIVDNLKDFTILKTIIKGKEAAEDGQPLLPYIKPEIENQFNTAYINADQIAIPSRGDKIKVIKAFDKKLETLCEIREGKTVDNVLVSDTRNDLLKLVVVCRYDKSPPAVGIVNGFGIKSGSIATSVSHDCHNIIAVGVDDVSIKRAINLVIKEKGGLGYVFEDESLILPLPIAGLMSPENYNYIADEYVKLLDMVKSYMDCKLTSPFMTLSFLSLEVIPELKLSNKGLFDVNKLAFTDLFTE